MGETLSGKSVSRRMKRSPNWYGRIPASVLLDSSLSAESVRAYAILSLKTYQGNIATLGLRELGKLLGISAATAMRRVHELIETGHVVAVRAKSGARMHYELTSPVFGQRLRDGERVLVQGDSGHVRNVGGNGIVSQPRKKTA